MRIFILIFLCIIISSCRTGSDLRADLNMALLTVETEEEFRNIALLKEFKDDFEKYKYEFIVDVPPKLVSKRLNHCYSNGQLYDFGQTKEDLPIQIVNYKNTYIQLGYTSFIGYELGFVYELDEIADIGTKVVWMQKGFDNNDIRNEVGQRVNNFALGISEGKSDGWTRTCNF